VNSYQIISWFQNVPFKCNLHRYTPGAKKHVGVLVEAALARVAAADQDQEVKEAGAYDRPLYIPRN
jgi:hypothetical protein